MSVFMGVPTMYALLLAVYDSMPPEQQVRLPPLPSSAATQPYLRWVQHHATATFGEPSDYA
jgi:hypothetical protein